MNQMSDTCSWEPCCIRYSLSINLFILFSYPQFKSPVSLPNVLRPYDEKNQKNMPKILSFLVTSVPKIQLLYIDFRVSFDFFIRFLVGSNCADSIQSNIKLYLTLFWFFSDSQNMKKLLPSRLDLLNDPVPSSVPSPDLHPREESPRDLISFDLSTYSGNTGV